MEEEACLLQQRSSRITRERATEISHRPPSRRRRFTTYRQEGDRVWAMYEGGGVRHGVLAARADGGWLVMRYLHADASGTVKHGTCVTAVATLPDGSLRLHEQWRWDGSNRDQESILDQVGVRAY